MNPTPSYFRPSKAVLLTIGTISMLNLFSTFPISAANEIIASDSSPLNKEREKLPKSIVLKRNDDGSFTYLISNIYNNSGLADLDDICKVFIPDCQTCAFDFRRKTCTMTTSRELSISELTTAVNEIANYSGDMPFWGELKARDLPVSERAKSIKFKVLKEPKPFGKPFAWFSMGKNYTPFEIPFEFSPIEVGRVQIAPRTGHCMAHPRYTIRILDSEGKVIWTDTETASSAITVAVSDKDQDMSHELLLRRNDHGSESYFRIIPEFDSIQGASPSFSTEPKGDH